jgi:hypothetical protein
MKKWLGVSIIILTLLYVACLGWLYAHHLLFYRRLVLELPIRFEEGFSFKRQFTVDMPGTYWVAIEYDEIFRSTPEVQLPHDEFTTDFEITSKDKLIAKGSTATHPDWSGPWANTGNRLIRYLGSFDAQPREVYQLSLRITAALPRLLPKRAKAIVEIDAGFDEFRSLRESLLLAVGVVIAIVILLYTWSMLRSRRKERS